MEEKNLIEQYDEVLEATGGSVEVQQEVTLDDLDNVPETEKFRIIKSSDRLPEVLTISNIKLGKAITKNDKGDFIEPLQNNKGSKYYKAKLIVEIEEPISGDRIRTFVPSIFYSVQEDGTVNKIPTIPKACEDSKIDDHFTPELSQLRNKYCKSKGVEPKSLSSSNFLKGLIGMKFTPDITTGTHKGKDYIKLVIKNFI